MELQMVPTASIAGMVFSLVVSFALPIGLLVYAKKKLRAKIAPFFIGCGVFLVMVLVLESAAHQLVFRLTGNLITGNLPLYALYAGAMAALFEETGRTIAMKFFVKPLNFSNTFVYGAGHGGFEAMALVGLTSISNVVSSVMINSGSMAVSLAALDAQTAASTIASLSALWTIPSLTFFAGGVERILAVALHMSLSLLVFCAVKNHSKKELLQAYGLHFIVDTVSVLLSAMVPIWVVELAVAVMTSVAVLAAKRACAKK